MTLEEVVARWGDLPLKFDYYQHNIFYFCGTDDYGNRIQVGFNSNKIGFGNAIDPVSVISLDDNHVFRGERWECLYVTDPKYNYLYHKYDPS